MLQVHPHLVDLDSKRDKGQHVLNNRHNAVWLKEMPSSLRSLTSGEKFKSGAANVFGSGGELDIQRYECAINVCSELYLKGHEGQHAS